MTRNPGFCGRLLARCFCLGALGALWLSAGCSGAREWVYTVPCVQEASSGVFAEERAVRDSGKAATETASRMYRSVIGEGMPDSGKAATETASRLYRSVIGEGMPDSGKAATETASRLDGSGIGDGKPESGITASGTGSRLDSVPETGSMDGGGRGVRIGARTNLLMDAAAIPNIGMEVALGRGFTLEGEWFYAWWRNNSRHRFWRVYGGNIGVRYYFGNHAERAGGYSYTGHHLGVYGGVFTFCFEWGGKGYMGGRPGHGLWDRCMVNAGVEYGYTFPVGRHINLDLSLGIGYIGGIVEKYTPRQGEYLRLSTTRLHWFGPTRAGISLVWLIGPGNYNTRKGGGR